MAGRTVTCIPIISRFGFGSIYVGGTVMATPDYWPEFQEPEAINSPIFLLKEQAAQLEQKTKGLVRAGLRPASTPEGNFWVGFDLGSPALGEYTYRLMEITYPPGPGFCPITVTAGDDSHSAKSLDQFRQLLQHVLKSPRTKHVVEAIMAQATALAPLEVGK